MRFQNESVDKKMAALEVPEYAQDWFYYFALEIARRDGPIPSQEKEWETFLRCADDAHRAAGGGFVASEIESAASAIYNSVACKIPGAIEFLDICLMVHRQTVSPNQVLITSLPKIGSSMGYGIATDVDWEELLKLPELSKYRSVVQQNYHNTGGQTPAVKRITELSQFAEYLRLHGINVDRQEEVDAVVASLPPSAREDLARLGWDSLAILMHAGEGAITAYCETNNREGQIGFWRGLDEVTRRDKALNILFLSFDIRDEIYEEDVLERVLNSLGVTYLPTSRLLEETLKQLYYEKGKMIVADIVTPLVEVLRLIGD